MKIKLPIRMRWRTDLLEDVEVEGPRLAGPESPVGVILVLEARVGMNEEGELAYKERVSSAL